MSNVATALKRAAITIGATATMVAAAVIVTGLAARSPSSTPAPRAATAAAPQPIRAAATTPVAPLDQPPADRGYVIKSALKLDQRLEHGDYAWNDEGVPQGEILITIDLKAQLLSIFRDGYEIGVAAILYGADDKPSPLGAFTITEKDADHVSRTYDNAPMPYMLRLTDDGVAIHGSDVKWGFATHGCIGVPTAFAKLLFEQTKLGDRVIITNGAVLNVGEAVPAA